MSNPFTQNFNHHIRENGNPQIRVNNLQRIHQEILKCRKCEFGHKRQNAVPGSWKIPAPVVLIGEGPGETEDAQGEPFVGSSGEILSMVLQCSYVGIKRHKLAILNAVKCRTSDTANQNMKPTKTQKVACKHFLNEQIKNLDPAIIMLLGNHAVDMVLGMGETGITKRRKMIYIAGTLEKYMIMATYHPSYVSREAQRGNQTIKQDFLQDFTMLASEARRINLDIF